MATCKTGETHRAAASGFTLLELLLALAILAAVMSITFLAFSTVTKAWQRGVQITDEIHHGDFVVEQLVMALRSAYYPAAGVDSQYGMWHGDSGSGEDGDDMLSWVKLGAALVGKDAPYAGGPHRVKVNLETDPDGNKRIALRSWGLLQEVEDFDEEDIEPVLLPAVVKGVDYRFEDPESEAEDEIEWIDEWVETNRLPVTVELTVTMEPTEKYAEPVVIKRLIPVPLGPLSWQATCGTVAGGGGEAKNP